MVKAIWAVACAAAAAKLFAATIIGCATVPVVPVQDNSVTKDGSAKTAGPAGPQYQIGPEDVLHVSVWENKELTLDAIVRPDGKISLPLVKDIQAEGLTADELSDAIHLKLQDYIKDPQVTVIVTQVNAPKIYVLGSVTRPGPYLLRSDMSILQALSLAGGFTQFASPRSIKLVRGTGLRQEVRKINYYNLLDDGGTENYLLKPGDTIVVP